ncbi:hypothetical protein BLOT_006309 [Blomia tropicalis]|nr:hypothetical protein BLOT_006309 [Blomia tropicalis]
MSGNVCHSGEDKSEITRIFSWVLLFWLLSPIFLHLFYISTNHKQIDQTHNERQWPIKSWLYKRYFYSKKKTVEFFSHWCMIKYLSVKEDPFMKESLGWWSVFCYQFNGIVQLTMGYSIDRFNQALKS